MCWTTYIPALTPGKKRVQSCFMAVNESKANTPRMWEKWRASGAIGRYDSALARQTQTAPKLVFDLNPNPTLEQRRAAVRTLVRNLGLPSYFNLIGSRGFAPKGAKSPGSGPTDGTDALRDAVGWEQTQTDLISGISPETAAALSDQIQGGGRMLQTASELAARGITIETSANLPHPRIEEIGPQKPQV